MTERPFIATELEICAVLEDGKVTVWRDIPIAECWHAPWHRGNSVWCFVDGFGRAMRSCDITCPLGQPGDRLWWQPPDTLPRWASRITTTNVTTRCELRDSVWRWCVEVERIPEPQEDGTDG